MHDAGNFILGAESTVLRGVGFVGASMFKWLLDAERCRLLAWEATVPVRDLGEFAPNVLPKRPLLLPSTPAWDLKLLLFVLKESFNPPSDRIESFKPNELSAPPSNGLCISSLNRRLRDPGVGSRGTKDLMSSPGEAQAA